MCEIVSRMEQYENDLEIKNYALWLKSLTLKQLEKELEELEEVQQKTILRHILVQEAIKSKKEE